MKRGPKPETPGKHIARRTFQPSRHGDRNEAIASVAAAQVTSPNETPQQPDWLTELGQQVWLDEIGRVLAAGLVKEVDTNLFGQYCNLVGFINLASSSGVPAPAAYYSEMRKIAELFGIAGARSRVKGKGDGGSAKANPFAANGRR